MSQGASQTMPSWALSRAQSDPDTTALITGDRVISYAQLGSGIEETARGLLAAGATRGSRVAIAARSDLNFVEVLHACQRLGAIFIPLNLRLSTTELETELRRVQPAVLLCDETTQDPLRKVATRLGSAAPRHITELTTPASASINLPPDDIDPDAEQVILFTSGTTARPKAVPLSHRNFVAGIDAGVERLGHAAHQRWLATMPLFHVGGLAILMRAARLGTTVVLQPRFDADVIARDLTRYRITGISLVATMLSRLLESADLEASYPDLQCMLIGGGPLPEELAQRALERGLPIAPTYGMTETTAQVATAVPGAPVPAAGFVGQPLAGVEVRIRNGDRTGRGEIELRGPQITPGYLDQDPGEEARLRDGWLRTGDLGHVDAGGNLYVEDRVDDLIISGGENVSPNEVEGVLIRHPEIEDAAVVGRQDAQWGQRIEAYLVLPRESGEIPPNLEEWCRRHLAGYKVPRRFHRRARLPRTPSGKLQRRRLADASDNA